MYMNTCMWVELKTFALVSCSMLQGFSFGFFPPSRKANSSKFQYELKHMETLAQIPKSSLVLSRGQTNYILITYFHR